MFITLGILITWLLVYNTYFPKATQRASADGTPIFFNTAAGSSDYYNGSRVFASTPVTAISSIVSSDGNLKVTHDFHPSSVTQNLYEVTVTLDNIGGTTINEPRYK